jgi:hypothetical protein
MLQVGVRSDKHTEPCGFGSLKQLAVLQCGPTALKGGRDRVSSQELAQRRGRSLIEENLHLCRCESVSCRVLQDRTNLLDVHAREPFDEIGDRGATF